MSTWWNFSQKCECYYSDFYNIKIPYKSMCLDRNNTNKNRKNFSVFSLRRAAKDWPQRQHAHKSLSSYWMHTVPDELTGDCSRLFYYLCDANNVDPVVTIITSVLAFVSKLNDTCRILSSQVDIILYLGISLLCHIATYLLVNTRAAGRLKILIAINLVIKNLNLS